MPSVFSQEIVRILTNATHVGLDQGAVPHSSSLALGRGGCLRIVPRLAIALPYGMIKVRAAAPTPAAKDYDSEWPHSPAV